MDIATYNIKAIKYCEQTVPGAQKKTGLVVVSEGVRMGGFASEVPAQMQAAAFDWLDAPIACVTSEDVPMPYNSDARVAA